MPEEGGQQRHLAVDVVARGVPVEHGAHGEGMAQVIGPRPGARAAAVQAGPTDQLGEGLIEFVAGNPPAAGGDEERRRSRLREAGVTLADVFAQRGDGAVVQRDLALLFLFARADVDDPVP